MTRFRRLFLSALLLSFLVSIFCIFSLAASGKSIVYVAGTGTKYHSKGCSYLQSKNSITLSEAVEKGYAACSYCNPPLLDGESRTYNSAEEFLESFTVPPDEYGLRDSSDWYAVPLSGTTLTAYTDEQIQDLIDDALAESNSYTDEQIQDMIDAAVAKSEASLRQEYEAKSVPLDSAVTYISFFILGILLHAFLSRITKKLSDAKDDSTLRFKASELSRKEFLLSRRETELTQKEAKILRLEKSIDERSANLEKGEKALSEKKAEFSRHNPPVPASNSNQELRNLEMQLQSDYAQRSFADLHASGLISLLPSHFPRDNPCLWPTSLQRRLVSSVNDSLVLKAPFECSATITGSKGDNYQTSLVHCTCEDFRHHGAPCKHMLFLAISLGCFSQLGKASFDTSMFKSEIEASISAKKEADASIRKLTNLKKDILKVISEKEQTYPWLARLLADLYTKYDYELSRELQTKRRPAPQAAQNVRKLSSEYHSTLLRLKQCQFQIAVYEAAFPFLLEFKTLSPEDASRSSSLYRDDGMGHDRLNAWLSKPSKSQFERDAETAYRESAAIRQQQAAAYFAQFEESTHR